MRYRLIQSRAARSLIPIRSAACAILIQLPPESSGYASGSASGDFRAFIRGILAHSVRTPQEERPPLGVKACGLLRFPVVQARIFAENGRKGGRCGIAR